MSSEIKTVGKSGQVSLGKRYAGKLLRLDRRADGSIVLTAVAAVPESQLWTIREPDRTAIARGLEWAARTPRAESDPALILARASKKPRAKRYRGDTT
ncbi:MAG TPA: hypothetical protein VHR45_09935 [Thermoanaerobaculia bacterium]|nr:hypothetical protein [Thermoanaerobaculia bacterium]